MINIGTLLGLSEREQKVLDGLISKNSSLALVNQSFSLLEDFMAGNLSADAVKTKCIEIKNQAKAQETKQEEIILTEEETNLLNRLKAYQSFLTATNK